MYMRACQAFIRQRQSAHNSLYSGNSRVHCKPKTISRRIQSVVCILSVVLRRDQYAIIRIRSWYTRKAQSYLDVLFLDLAKRGHYWTQNWFPAEVLDLIVTDKIVDNFYSIELNDSIYSRVYSLCSIVFFSAMSSERNPSKTISSFQNWQNGSARYGPT